MLPPINPKKPASWDRSPYRVSLLDLVAQLGGSRERSRILSGLLAFRAILHSAGLVEGFQWLDGSFLEDVETIEHRAPRDIDVVTFFHMPTGQTQTTLLRDWPALFDSRSNKDFWSVDTYFVELTGDQPEVLIRQATYWYSLWSHRRDGRWKGYLQIDLADIDDQKAKDDLQQLSDQSDPP